MVSRWFENSSLGWRAFGPAEYLFHFWIACWFRFGFWRSQYRMVTQCANHSRSNCRLKSIPTSFLNKFESSNIQKFNIQVKIINHLSWQTISTLIHPCKIESACVIYRESPDCQMKCKFLDFSRVMFANVKLITFS